MSFLLDEEKSWIQRDFGLDRRLIKALSKLGYTYPTLVQSRCIPIALQGKDVLVRARTGSGKTVAFSLPLLHKLLTNKSAEPSAVPRVQGLILAPTKELCKQIEKHVIELVYYCRDVVTICALTDDNITVQQHRLQSKPDIVISTPARLVQQLKSGSIDLSGVKTLVIDEADLVLSFGYTEDVHTITAKMPKIFQGLLMSATLSPELDKFKRVLLHNPAVLRLEEEKGIGELLQFYLSSSESDKFLVLYVFIKLGLLQGKGLIFVNDVNKCYKLKLFLQQFFISAAVLNAEVPAASRIHMLEEFNRGVFDYLIATDAGMDHGELDEYDVGDDVGDDEEDGDGDEGEGGGEDEGEEDGDVEREGEIDMDALGDDSDDGDDDDGGEDFDIAEEDNEEDEGLDGEAGSLGGEGGKSTGKRSRQPSDKPSDKAAAAAAAKATTAKERGRQANRKSDADYGVSRGIDFQGVTFVINFDFPATPAAYTHRIGRTARGGASGTALSFVTLASAGADDAPIAARDAEVLRTVRAQQPCLGVVEGDNVLAAIGDVRDAEDPDSRMQPAPLNFNMIELESFRYRVDDTARSVTAAAVKEFRVAEIKREILHSAKLKTHFAENPNDLKVLRHDKAILHPITQKDHLKHVPEYLIPQSMRSVANTTGGGKRKKRRKAPSQGVDRRIQQSRQKDPLLGGSSSSSSGEAADAGAGEGAGEGTGADFGDEGGGGDEGEGTGDSGFTGGGGKAGLSGRQEWKMRHQKGKFNAKQGKKNEHRVKGAFVKSKKYK